MAIDRKTLNGLLSKLGATNPGKLEEARAVKKLGVLLKANGVPAGLEDAEKALVDDLPNYKPGKVDIGAVVDKASKKKGKKVKTGKKAKTTPTGERVPRDKSIRAQVRKAVLKALSKAEKGLRLKDLVAAVAATGLTEDQERGYHVWTMIDTDLRTDAPLFKKLADRGMYGITAAGKKSLEKAPAKSE